jgi:polar amino acid transport system substrate-binding protein
MEDFLESDEGACCEIKGAVAPTKRILGRASAPACARATTSCARRSTAASPQILEDGTYDEITARYFEVSIYGN